MVSIPNPEEELRRLEAIQLHLMREIREKNAQLTNLTVQVINLRREINGQMELFSI